MHHCLTPPPQHHHHHQPTHPTPAPVSLTLQYAHLKLISLVQLYHYAPDIDPEASIITIVINIIITDCQRNKNAMANVCILVDPFRLGVSSQEWRWNKNGQNCL